LPDSKKTDGKIWNKNMEELGKKDLRLNLLIYFFVVVQFILEFLKGKKIFP